MDTELIRSSNHLTKNIKATENPFQFKCEGCRSQDIYFSSLSIHLKSNQHRKLVISTGEEEDVRQVLEVLADKRNMPDNSDNRASDQEILPYEETKIDVLNTTKLTKEKNEIMFRIEIANFIIQNNLPFRFVASLTDFIKHITYAHKRPIS